MIINHVRYYFGEKVTLSKITISGYKPFWYACEDVVRGDGDYRTVEQWKIKGQSAIPYGDYQLAYIMSPGRKRHTLRLLNVPGFQGILIHPGNTEKDTEGCILPGKTLLPNNAGVGQSRDAVSELENIIVPQMIENNTCIWRITKETTNMGMQ